MPTDIVLNKLDVVTKGIGVDLPFFEKQGSGIKVNYSTLDQAVANGKNLLLTNHGERVMLPTFGCNLYRMLFDNQTEFLIENTKATIQDQFNYWLPYIFINKLDVITDPDYNTMYISMTISLKNNQFDTRSIELEVRRRI